MLAVAALLLVQADPDPPPPQETTIAVVKVAATILRAEPDFACLEVVAKLRRGDKLRVLGHEGRWLKALPPNGETPGFLHQSAVAAARPIRMNEKLSEPEKDGAQVTQALAVKGFDQETEKRYRSQKQLDAEYKLLDSEVLAKPAFKADPVERARALAAFREAGGLSE
jgi:hypothetical protein